MKGQASEFIMVFAGVVLMAIVILSYAYRGFPFLIYDSLAVVRAQSIGYDYELNSFVDGAIATYSADYNTESHGVTLTLTETAGWDTLHSRIVDEVNKIYNAFGYRVS